MKLTKLQKAVIEQMGYDVKKDKDEYLEVFKSLRNAADGYNGFIYYSETIDFWKKNKKEIIQHLKDLALELGEKSYLDVVLGFQCFKNSDITIDDIAEVIYANNENNDYYTNIVNALSWYALEETAFELANE